MTKFHTLLLALLAMAGTTLAQNPNQTISISNSGLLQTVLQGTTISNNAKIIIEEDAIVTVNGTVATLETWNGVMVVKGTLAFGSPALLKLGLNARIQHVGTIDMGVPSGNSTKVQFGSGNGANGTQVGTSALNTFANSPGTVLNSAYNGNPSTLPVSLMYFRGKATTAGVNLEWATASEKDNDRFEIEASADGQNWTTVGRVYSLNPNSEAKQYYSFEHRGSTTSYYRLKQVDLNGEFTHYTTYVRNSASAEKVAQVEYRTLDGRLVNANTPGTKVKVNYYEAGTISSELAY